MITSLLLFLVYGLIYLITLPLRAFPDVSLPDFLGSTISQANTYIGVGRVYLPHTVDTMLITWGVLLTIELAIFAYKGMMWIIRRIPGQG